MHVRPIVIRRILALVSVAFALATSSRAQTTLLIDGATRAADGSGGFLYDTWKPLLGYPGGAQTGADGYMADPLNDQQTGQYDSDFASMSGTVSGPGFLVQFGTIGGVEHLAFRIVMNEYKTTGNLVNIRVGFDGNYDGKVDLFMGPSLQNNQYGLVFQGTGTGLNVSPSTTTLTNAFYPTAAGVGSALPFSATNFSNIELTAANIATYYPGWTMQNGKTAGDNDALISFAIPVAHINQALAQLGATHSIDSSTYMRWIAFTATQNNSINQDVYGLPKITNSNGVGDVTWDSFLPYMNGSGQPVPEPASYGCMLGLGLVAWGYLRRRPRRS